MRLSLFSLALVLGLAAPSAAQRLHDVSQGNRPAGIRSAPVAGEAPDLAWAWSPEPRWLSGVQVSRRTFFGGLDFGTHFYGTTVAARDIPPVLLVFDEDAATLTRSFALVTGLPDQGPGRFRGEAYDMSDPSAPRRLNVGFLEEISNGLWDPDDSNSGRQEFLLIFSSDYDGTGQTYEGQSAYDQDTYYGLAPRTRAGYTLYASAAEMTLTPGPLREVTAEASRNGEVLMEWVAPAFVGGTEVQILDQGTLLATAAPADEQVLLTGLDPDRELTVEVRLLDASSVLAVRTATVTPRVSDGVVAASNLDPGRRGSSTYGDTWGYTAPDGTEYGLLAVRAAGLSVIDISQAPAASPVEVGFLPRNGSDAKDVKVYGSHAYVVHEQGPIQIVDLTDPSAPVEVGTLDVQPGVSSGGSHNVLVADDHLWVTGGRTSGNAGVRVYSLADPTAPSFVGAFNPTHHPTPYYHDFEVRDGIGYGPAIYDGAGVDALDVSDPSDIRLITTFTYPGAGAHNTCTTEDGATVYVGDEIGSSGNWIRIFDVSDLGNPEFVGEVVVDAEAVVHNCYVRGDRLYVAHYTEGLRVYDISDPHAPVQTAYFDTYAPTGYGYRGAWTAYPYFASGKVIVSDMQSGLWVMELGDGSVASELTPARGGALRVFPNPTAGTATLAYSLAAPAEAEMVVVDMLGREVARPAASGQLGAHRVPFDTALWPAGIYVARLSVDGRLWGTTALTVTR